MHVTSRELRARNSLCAELWDGVSHQQSYKEKTAKRQRNIKLGEGLGDSDLL